MATRCILLFQPNGKFPLGSLIQTQILHIQNWTTIASSQPVLPLLSSSIDVISFWWLRPKNLESSLMPFFFLSFIRKFSWVYFQSIPRLQLFLTTDCHNHSELSHRHSHLGYWNSFLRFLSFCHQSILNREILKHQINITVLLKTLQWLPV